MIRPPFLWIGTRILLNEVCGRPNYACSKKTEPSLKHLPVRGVPQSLRHTIQESAAMAPNKRPCDANHVLSEHCWIQTLNLIAIVRCDKATAQKCADLRHPNLTRHCLCWDRR